MTTQGPVRFPEDYKGKWVILFSHPADFTPVCTTEFLTFATLMPQFDAINCKLLGLSIDSNYSHIAWLRTIKEKIKYKGMENVEVTFPVIADLKMEVAKLYGMLQPSADDSHAVRAVFIMDPEAKVRAVLYYPQSTAQLPGNPAPAGRPSDGGPAQGGHAGRLAAGRRGDRSSARLVWRRAGTDDQAGGRYSVPRLVLVPEASAQEVPGPSADLGRSQVEPIGPATPPHSTSQ